MVPQKEAPFSLKIGRGIEFFRVVQAKLLEVNIPNMASYVMLIGLYGSL